MMSDHVPTTAAGWLDKALHFIDTHPDGWRLCPGQDFHGWLLLARKALEEEKKKAVSMINAAMRISGKPAAASDVPKERTAEDERHDVLLKLDALAAEKAAHGFTASGTVATARRDAAVSALRMAYEVIERGDHVGPTVESTRIASDTTTAPQEVGPRLPHLSEVRRPAVTGNVRTAADERRDVLAFIKDEAGKFAAQAIADGWSERARDRLDGKASVLATILGYFERGDHVGAADR